MQLRGENLLNNSIQMQYGKLLQCIRTRTAANAEKSLNSKKIPKENQLHRFDGGRSYHSNIDQRFQFIKLNGKFMLISTTIARTLVTYR